MGRRNLKGTVSIYQDKSTIRLRWRYLSKRYSLNLFLYNKPNLLRAKKIALVIEDDIVTNVFDESLNRYKALITQSSQQHSSNVDLDHTSVKEPSRTEKSVAPDCQVNILKDFDRYITAKSMDPHSDDLSSYYTHYFASSASRIAALSFGEFVGMIADDPQTESAHGSVILLRIKHDTKQGLQAVVSF